MTRISVKTSRNARRFNLFARKTLNKAGMVMFLLAVMVWAGNVVAIRFESRNLSMSEVYLELDALRENGGTDEDMVKFKQQHGIRSVSLTKTAIDPVHNVEQTITIQFDRNGNVVHRNAKTEPLPLSFFRTPVHENTSEITQNCWVDYDEHRNHWIIYGEVSKKQDAWEQFPASYDALGIGWDPDVLDFYDYGTSALHGGAWLSDAGRLGGGTMMFTLHDNWQMQEGNFVSCWVVLDQKAAHTETSGRMKYEHTYFQKKSTTSQTGSVSIRWGQPGGGGQAGYSWSVTPSEDEASWSKVNTAYFTTYS